MNNPTYGLTNIRGKTTIRVIADNALALATLINSSVVLYKVNIYELYIAKKALIT